MAEEMLRQAGAFNKKRTQVGVSRGCAHATPPTTTTTKASMGMDGNEDARGCPGMRCDALSRSRDAGDAGLPEDLCGLTV